MRLPAARVPETLTLVDEDLRTLIVEEEMGLLLVTATGAGNRVRLRLTEAQARRLRARIEKYFRDNR